MNKQRIASAIDTGVAAGNTFAKPDYLAHIGVTYNEAAQALDIQTWLTLNNSVIKPVDNDQ